MDDMLLLSDDQFEAIKSIISDNIEKAPHISFAELDRITKIDSLKKGIFIIMIKEG